MNFESSQTNLPSFIQATCGCQLDSMIWTDGACLVGCCWPEFHTPILPGPRIALPPASPRFGGVCDLTLPPANSELFTQQSPGIPAPSFPPPSSKTPFSTFALCTCYLGRSRGFHPNLPPSKIAMCLWTRNLGLATPFPPSQCLPP